MPQVFLAALKSKKITIRIIVIRAHRNIFIFEASCSYLLASTSYFLAYCIFIRAAFMLQDAMLSLAPIPITSWDVSIAIFFITAMHFYIYLIYSSYSSNNFFLKDYPSNFQTWICCCFWPITLCDYLIRSYLIDYSFLYIQSAENAYKNYLTLVFNRSILSEFYYISIRLFCLSMKEVCYFWKSRINDFIFLTSAVMIEAFNDFNRSIDEQIELPNFSITFYFYV